MGSGVLCKPRVRHSLTYDGWQIAMDKLVGQAVPDWTSLGKDHARFRRLA